MIGLTCSWAWSIGPILSTPPPLCVLTSLIAEGRRGAVSQCFFLSVLSLNPFLSFSTSFHWWPTCQQLLLWQAVNALYVTEWYTVFPHESISSCPVSALLQSNRWSVTMSNPVFTLLHCVQWFLAETLCAKALAVTQCSLHQSSNEAVATLAPAPIEPRTNSLPGGSVFQSTGPPSRLPPFLPQLTSPSNLYIIVYETPRKDFLSDIWQMNSPSSKRENVFLLCGSKRSGQNYVLRFINQTSITVATLKTSILAQ